MDCVYELVDLTDNEQHFTVGIYSTLEKALAELDQPCPPDTYNPCLEWDAADFEIRRRPIDQLSEYSKKVAHVRWVLRSMGDDQAEDQWDRIVRIVNEGKQ